MHMFYFYISREDCSVAKLNYDHDYDLLKFQF